jgi:hypothetical protein
MIGLGLWLSFSLENFWVNVILEWRLSAFCCLSKASPLASASASPLASEVDEDLGNTRVDGGRSLDIRTEKDRHGAEEEEEDSSVLLLRGLVVLLVVDAPTIEERGCRLDEMRRRAALGRWRLVESMLATKGGLRGVRGLSVQETTEEQECDDDDDSDDSSLLLQFSKFSPCRQVRERVGLDANRYPTV